MGKSHSLHFESESLTINGILQVVEMDEKEARFKLEGSTLCVKGSGLNIVKLDKEQGNVLLQVKTLTSVTYKQTIGIKGLFR